MLRGASLAAPALVAALTCGCQKFADLDVTYQDWCAPRTPYVEQFEGDYQALRERCWTAENVENRQLSVDGDLILGYSDKEPAAVTLDSAPTLSRTVSGNFMFVTHLEVSEALTSGFCLHPGDAAGISVLRRATGELHEVRYTMLIAPDRSAPDIDCQNDAPNPPPVRASVGDSQTDSIWESGEADIAVCRKDGKLAYFYRQPTYPDPDAPWAPSEWRPFTRAGSQESLTDEVGDGPLEVGLIALEGEMSRSYEVPVQGDFNWAALLNVTNDCPDALERLSKSQPSND